LALNIPRDAAADRPAIGASVALLIFSALNFAAPYLTTCAGGMRQHAQTACDNVVSQRENRKNSKLFATVGDRAEQERGGGF
jgi:hypothetical protein